jgi:hypothetical protein
MSLSKSMLDDLNRDLDPEPLDYGEEVEDELEDEGYE